MTPIRIVIADDHPIFLDGLRRLLEAEPEFLVVGEATTGQEALRIVTERAPDLLLLDVCLPDISGLEVLRTLTASGSDVRIVMVTAAIDGPDATAALQFGAKGLVLKTFATSLLYKCIRSVIAGEYWFGHEHLSDVVQALRTLNGAESGTPLQKLTKRELDIIAAVVNGCSNRDISHQFGLSEHTVKNHLSHIFDKVGVSSRLELALSATHHKLIPASKR